MPFKSDSQRKLCYLLKGKGQAGSWDCDEWSTATGKKDLPEHVEDQAEKKALETNKLKGGEGDNKKPSDFSKGVLDEGTDEEKEHTTDSDMAKEIAMDHLTQDPNYYTKLKKIEKSSSFAAVKALYSIWSDSSPLKAAAERTLLSKLSSVITSPGRGSGDEEETAINPDSSEGMQVTKPPKPVPGKMSFNKQPLKPVAPLGAARNALRRVTEKNLGFDPAGGVKQAQTKLYQLAKGIPGNMYRSMFGNKPRVPRQKKERKDWDIQDFCEEHPELNDMSFQDLYNQSENKILENKAKDQSTKQAEGPSYMQQVYQNFANPVKSVGEFGSAFHSIANNIDDSNKSREMAYRQQSQLGSANRARANAAPSASGTAPARNFDFSSISSKAKLDPSILGTAPARGFDFANMKKSLQNTGRQVGAAATSEVEKWVQAPGWTSPREVLKRRSQALGAQKAMGQATDSAGKVMNLGKNFLSAGGTLMGMGKQSDVAAPSAGAAPAPKAAAPAPKVTAPAPALGYNNTGNAFREAASGAGGAISNAFLAATGNQQSYNDLQAQANKPGFEQELNNWTKSLSAIGQTVKDKLPDIVSNAPRFKTVPGVGPEIEGHSVDYKVPLTAFESSLRLPRTMLEAGTVKNLLNRPVSGQFMNTAKSVMDYIPGASQAATAIGQGATNWGTNRAINYEAGRRTAGYALPVVNFMQNNPWAKYLLGALGTGVAGYGLHSMFGGQQKQQNGQAEGVLQNSYNQGLKGA